jgi:hypothetical protein
MIIKKISLNELRILVKQIIKEESEYDNIKSDIDFVFKNTPELYDIGTQEQYYEYIKKIFPNTKVKGIFYHSSPNKFTEFRDPSSSGLSHIWFSEKPLIGQYGKNIYAVLLDIRNPLKESDSNYHKEIKSYENPINPDWGINYNTTGELPKFKYDGTIRSSRVDDGKSITVRNPKQIHILGSEKDLDSFKNYIKK